MEENKNLPAVRLNLPPDKLTPEVIKSFFQKEISRKDYQQVLQKLELVKPTKENLPQSGKVIGEVNKVIKELQEFAKSNGESYFKTHRSFLAVMKEILEPILSKVQVIEAEIKSKNDELLVDLEKARVEQARIDNIKSTMKNFINNCTAFITIASDAQIANIQKRIGTEKSRSKFYAEFLDEFKEKCKALDPLINERKEHLRKEADLLKAETEALQSGDVEGALDIKEKLEQLESDKEENILRLQEEAFEQISKDEPVYAAEPAGEALKGRNYWRWEVEDMLKLYKKHPDLVILQPNKEAIDKFMAENREQWYADGKKEVQYDGVKFFIKKYL